MAFDEALADRVRLALSGRRVSEKRMFGGIAWLRDGKMFVGIVKDELMVRVGPNAHEAAVARPHARTMDFTGRPMKGYVFVAPPGVRNLSQIRRWADQAYEFVATVVASPRKGAKKRRG